MMINDYKKTAQTELKKGSYKKYLDIWTKE